MKKNFILNSIKAGLLTFALSSTVNAADKPQIALLMKTLSNEYFISMQQGAEETAAKMGVDLTIQVAEKEDSTEQLVGLVENMIAKKWMLSLLLQMIPLLLSQRSKKHKRQVFQLLI